MRLPRNVALLAFDDVEVLDFAGPFEVFNVASELSRPAPFQVYTIGLTPAPALARGKLGITPRYLYSECPQPDILLIPGGQGTRPLLRHAPLINWIREQAGKVEWLLSVCTGALLLAQAGLLENRNATTHHGSFELLSDLCPTTRLVPESRFVQSADNIMTSGGISAGIDLALHMVGMLSGPEAQAAVIDQMEYNWHH
jgi:transcriptional regulator GlxA family with amidase domain